MSGGGSSRPGLARQATQGPPTGPLCLHAGVCGGKRTGSRGKVTDCAGGESHLLGRAAPSNRLGTRLRCNLGFATGDPSPLGHAARLPPPRSPRYCILLIHGGGHETEMSILLLSSVSLTVRPYTYIPQ